MPMELRPLQRRLSLQKTRVEGVTLYTGRLGEREVVAIVTGMGTALARRGVERLLGAVEVERVVVVGITGAVDNVTPIGTLVVPEAVVDSATGVEHRPEPLGGAVPHGKMWTGDTLITQLDVIADLRSRGVVSLDMETAIIGEVCERRGVAWSVFRVISDRATDGSINEEVFHLSHQDGKPDTKAVVRYFLRHPFRIPRMLRLARGANMGAARAAEEAIRACS
jgi:adenosylhomocysteine nucleosidase